MDDPISYKAGGISLQIGEAVRVKVPSLRGELAVRVLDRDNFPVAGARVHARSIKMKVTPLDTPESEQGENAGVVTFRNLIPGEYAITAEHGGIYSEPVYVVVQAGNAPPLPPPPTPLERAVAADGRPADPSVAEAVFPGDGRDAPASPDQERDAAPQTPNQGAIQARSAAASSDPNAEFPVADLIRYVQAVERAYPKDSPREILTRIRQQYYSGSPFRQLIPDAPHSEPKANPRRFRTDEQPRLLEGDRVDPDAFVHLTAKADENGRQRNPSPYVLFRDEKIDLGHVLLTLDCLRHPNTAAPYTLFGIKSIDPASWIGDLAPASYWTETHASNGSPGNCGDPVKLPSADPVGYYKMSAPDNDLLGDFDGFGAFKLWKDDQNLSELLKAYYLGPPGGVSTRCRDFCKANALTFNASGSRVTVDRGSLRPWAVRIDRLCDLFDYRDNIGVNLFAAVLLAGLNTLPTPPPPKVWMFTTKVTELFSDSLARLLEKELGAAS